ncbi:MAG: hypothetical protein HYR55_02850 [Acidobacteria bacterium]|nr:hypothetical protein [Acidobacteriota bacterium]MBI3655946.1 hypothetical protein [Acidobacteriota bacterium]
MALKQRGNGKSGFILTLLVFVVCGYIGFTVFPVYYNAKEFESALVNEGVRAGARFYNDEVITKDVIRIAKSFEINLRMDNIHIRKFGDKVELTVEYDLPLDFSLIKYTYSWHFVARTTSHLGML